MPDTQAKKTRDRPTRILVLDDHAMSRHYAVAALRQAGVTVKAAGCPAAALRTALRWLPQAVVVDIRLPGTDGHAWIGNVRDRWPEHRPLPRFILLSAERPERPERERDRPLADPPLIRLRKPAAPRELRAALGIGPCPGDGGQSDFGTAFPPVELAALFRSELKRRLPELDDHLAERDLRAAALLLHQLLAASRMCRERNVEDGLRGLLQLCRTHAASSGGSTEIARSYFGLLGAAAPLIDARSAPSG